MHKNDRTSEPSEKGRKAQFTLIELLTVITVIAIMASFLLPAMNKAKATSRQIKCAGNLKQIGTAAHFYASDNNEYLPVGMNSVTNVRNWGYLLNYYLQPGGPNYSVPLYFYTGYNNSFVCPVQPTWLFRLRAGGCGGYAWNWQCGFLDTYTGALGYWKLQQIKKAVSIVWDRNVYDSYPIANLKDMNISECAEKEMAAPSTFDTTGNYGSSSNLRMSLRHNGGSNFCFTDGHVNAYRPKELIDGIFMPNY